MALLPIILLAGACDPTSQLPRLEEAGKRIEISKGPCMGQCPVYTLTVYNNGLATYRGERFTEKEGLFVKKLDKETYEQLLQSFDNTNLWQFNTVYPTEFPDLPTVSITYFDEEGNRKQVIGKDSRPQPVLELEKLLDAVANGTGWTTRDGQRSVATAGRTTAPPELIVQLDPGVSPQAWVIPYVQYELTIKEGISPNGNYWLFTFNPATIDPQQLLDRIRQDRYVYSAQFNRGPVEYRNEQR